MPRRPIAAVVLAACLVLAGCAGVGNGGGNGAADGASATQASDAMQGAAPATEGGDGGSQSGDGSDGAADPTDLSNRAARQALVRTGTVTLEVDDYDAARTSLVATVRGMGGFVGDSDQQLHREGNRTWTTGQVVLRVPAERFGDLLSAAKREGTVVSEGTQTRDVGDQLVDLEARLENLRARRDRLRAFYDRANSTEELLAVEERLSSVQGKIERLKAQKRALEEDVAYSTLTVKLREPEPDVESRETENDDGTAFHRRSVVAAFLDSVDALVVFVRATLVAFAYVAPFLVAFVVPAGALGLVAWRRRSD